MSSLRTGRRMHGLRQRGNRSGKHPDRPEYIATYRTQEKASREEFEVENTEQTSNWGRSVQDIREEIGTGGQCSMLVWRARTDG